MDRRKSMDVETFKDHTIDFIGWMNDHESDFTEDEKKHFVTGFETVVIDEPIQKHLFAFKNLILRWSLEWKRKSRNENEENSRKKISEDFHLLLQRYYEAVSDCRLQELSGVQEKAFRVIKEYIRSQIRVLKGDALLQSEDLR